MRDEDDQLYIYKLYGVSRPRKIRAQHTLRSKIGPSAKITEEQVRQAQQVINSPEIDFTPYAMDLIAEIEDAIMAMQMDSYGRENDFNRLTVPLSNIKGQAGMFGNWFATDLSQITLKFLEQYKRLDNDALDIISVYCRGARASYDLRLYKPDYDGAQDILMELNYAINRYNEKFKKRTGRG